MTAAEIEGAVINTVEFLSGRAVRGTAIITGLAVAVLLPLYTADQPTPTLRMVRNIGLPWLFWSALFLVYVALLVLPSTRVGGYLLGFVLYGFFGVALMVSAHRTHTPYPVISGAAIIDTAIFHVAAAKAVMIRRVV